MTLAVVLFCASAAMAKDIRTAVFKVAQMKCDADKTNVEKLKEGFQKFHYEAEFVKETKQDDKK